MDTVAALSIRDRSDLFRETAAQMGFHPAIVEKDFWVCWTLKHLFTHSEYGAHLIFKGGTTLSKVYCVIQRFSEDIDVSISRELLGFTGELDPAQPDLGSKKRNRLLDQMTETCTDYIYATLMRELRQNFTTILGDGERRWGLAVDKNDQQTIFFQYPTEGERLGYIDPHVRIELGCRSDSWPSEQKMIQPFCAEHFPGLFQQTQVPVRVLNVTRTFWEKATILHQEFHRPAEKAVPPRYARHYYDLAMLAGSNYKTEALAERALLESVVKHKQCFFRCGWAHYDTARSGSLRLVPAEIRRPGLRTDYNAMRIMFFGEVPNFDDIVSTLVDLEKEINDIADR
jgi:hypothetical protein